MVKLKRYQFTPEQLQRFAPPVAGKSGNPGCSGGDNLAFVNGVLWVLRSGEHWHHLPE